MRLFCELHPPIRRRDPLIWRQLPRKAFLKAIGSPGIRFRNALVLPSRTREARSSSSGGIRFAAARGSLRDHQELQRRRRISRHWVWHRSEEHTSELQSHHDLVCRLLLEKKKENKEKFSDVIDYIAARICVHR